MNGFSVAIDGPSGAGKSTLARAIASQFGFIYVDTGAMYRTIGLYVLRKGIPSEDAASIIPLLPEIQLSIRHDQSGQRITLNGEDVTEQIRTAEASVYASNVSKIPEVRTFLLETQRAFAKKNPVIMDGRDIGTVVLPDADVKIFLTAALETRAMRRFKEMQANGQTVSLETVLQDLIWRDENDSSRAVAPLRAAEDAVLLDTTSLSFSESVQEASAIIQRRLQSGMEREEDR